MSKAKTEEEAKYQVYLDERKALVEGEHTSADQFDKTIITLAAGALGLSLIFLEKIAPNPLANTVVYLYIAWGALVLSLFAILSSFLLSQHAFRRQRKILEDEIFAEDGAIVNKKNCWAQVTLGLNWFSIAAFILGAVMLAAFSIQNVTHTFDQKENHTNHKRKKGDSMSKEPSRRQLNEGIIPQQAPIIRGRTPATTPRPSQPQTGIVPTESPRPPRQKGK